MDARLAAQAKRALNACGGVDPARGNMILPWPPKGFLLPMYLPAGQTVTFSREITGEAPWELRAISSDRGMATPSGASQTVGVRLQIQLPNGRYLIGGNGADVSQFGWIGSWRHLIDPPVECEPGSKIQVTLSDTGGAPLATNLLFEGNYRYALDGQPPKGRTLSALQIPRVQGVVNENILAPCWMAGYPQPGPNEDYFVYSSPATVSTASYFLGAGYPVGTPLALPSSSATLKIPIDTGLDFVCRRIVVSLEADSTATAGVVLGRLRLGTGYALCDNFIDLARYLNGVEFPKGWTIRGGDSVYVDVALVDAAGTGNYYVQIFLEGYKRRLG